MAPAPERQSFLPYRDPLDSSGFSGRLLMSRALTYLFIAGGAFALVTLLVPDAHAEASQVLPIAGLSFAVAVLLAVAGHRLPIWGYHACLATGTVLIEWAIFVSDNPTSLTAMFFLWIAVYAFYFFTTLEAAVQAAFIALTYAVGLTLIDDPGEAPFLSWLTTTVAVVVVGGMIGGLKHRLDFVMSRLAEANQADTVTGLQNEAGFAETLDVELERARRSGTRVTVMIGRLDPGEVPERSRDKVLELVGRMIDHEKRRVDAGARLENEFALVLPYTDAQGATVMAERLRTSIRESFTENELDLTMSFGISSFPRNGTTAEALLHAAREALDSARELGSDRVVVHQLERQQHVQHIEAVALDLDDPPPIPTAARIPRAPVE